MEKDKQIIGGIFARQIERTFQAIKNPLHMYFKIKMDDLETDTKKPNGYAVIIGSGHWNMTNDVTMRDFLFSSEYTFISVYNDVLLDCCF